MTGHPLTEENKKEIIDYYLSRPMTLKELEEKFSLSHPTISRILKNVPRYSKTKLFSPELIEDFFDTIDCEEKAYFLGIMISDGNVFRGERGQSMISITLKEEDKYILEKFKEVVKSNRVVSSDGRGCYQVAILSERMAKDLEKYGVVPRKSLISYLPKIEYKYMNHLLRGIFDGDGSIDSKLIEDGMGHRTHRHKMSYCGTRILMEQISEYLYNTLNLKIKPLVYTYKNKSLSEIKMCSINDMCLFGEYIYKDATIFLKRKHDKYISFKEYYGIH